MRKLYRDETITPVTSQSFRHPFFVLYQYAARSHFTSTDMYMLCMHIRIASVFHAARGCARNPYTCAPRPRQSTASLGPRGLPREARLKAGSSCPTCASDEFL